MPEAVPATLVAVAVLGLWFPNTRGLSLGAIAALTAKFPWIALLAVVLSAAAFYLVRLQQR